MAESGVPWTTEGGVASTGPRGSYALSKIERADSRVLQGSESCVSYWAHWRGMRNAIVAVSRHLYPIAELLDIGREFTANLSTKRNHAGT